MPASERMIVPGCLVGSAQVDRACVWLKRMGELAGSLSLICSIKVEKEKVRWASSTSVTVIIFVFILE